jgi:hypothetical protein
MNLTDKFIDWTDTETGRKCTEKVCNITIFSRMLYAFEGGFDLGIRSGLHDSRLQKTLEWYEGKLRESRSEVAELKKQIEQITS